MALQNIDVIKLQAVQTVFHSLENMLGIMK